MARSRNLFALSSALYGKRAIPSAASLGGHGFARAKTGLSRPTFTLYCQCFGFCTG